MQVIVPFPADNTLSLAITVQAEYIVSIKYSLNSQSIGSVNQSSTLAEKNRADEIRAEFINYFQHPAHVFSLPYRLDSATEFQQRVCTALTTIPVGEVISYSSLAKQLNSSPRAVGNACRANRIPVIIPCHRVVSKTGLGGYAGDTLEKQKGSIHYIGIKLWLLEHEKSLLDHETQLPEYESVSLKYAQARPE